jgi:hypothetical protein
VSHKCKGPQLLLLERSTNTNNIKCEKVIDELLKENVPKLQHELEISLHALTGWSTLKTMIVTSKVGQYEFMVLIDNELTKDFIGDIMTNALHLHVVSTKPFTMRVVNGNKLHCQERFEHVHIMLQGIYFSFALYLSYLTRLDLVFGVQWLEQLGLVVCNWKTMIMGFIRENQVRTLQGTDVNYIQSTSLKVVAKKSRQGNSMFAICIPSFKEVPQQENHMDM